ncbi:MAG: hypothetical protein H7122_20560 [Chitinophagaceae bacterium]|nr:hypothetical protein [Chitinophagaceae bacterium]
MLRRIVADPSFWILLLINLYCIYYYEQHPDGFGTIVWLYWGQSVLIGLFNFLDMLTIKDIFPGSMSVNDQPIQNTSKAKGCSAFFFLVHYGIFHFVYMIFLLVQVKGLGKIDFRFILLGLAAFSIDLILTFMRNKRQQQFEAVNIGKMFFLPYLRVIPMHIMILGPAFLHWEASTIFLVLKTCADLITYFIVSGSSVASPLERGPG